MGDKSWKAWERTVAKWFGGERRGPDVRGKRGGKTDIIADGWAVECKLLGRPAFSDLLAACRQAETNGNDLEIPVAVVKKKSARQEDALVVMRLPVFADWFLSPSSGDPPSLRSVALIQPETSEPPPAGPDRHAA